MLVWDVKNSPYKNVKDVYEEDQLERTEARDKLKENWDLVEPMFNVLRNDQKRFAAIRYTLATGQVKTPDDFMQSGVIFLHSEFSLEYLALSVVLAELATEMGHKNGRWLYARAIDRFLLTIKMPQKFGTHPGPILATTTDKERAKHEVPPLEELLKKGDRFLTDPS